MKAAPGMSGAAFRIPHIARIACYTFTITRHNTSPRGAPMDVATFACPSCPYENTFAGESGEDVSVEHMTDGMVIVCSACGAAAYWEQDENTWHMIPAEHRLEMLDNPNFLDYLDVAMQIRLNEEDDRALVAAILARRLGVATSARSALVRTLTADIMDAGFHTHRGE